MKYGLFIYEHSHNNLINIGDYIQSIAAKQFLPKVDEYVERDHLNNYAGDKIKVIMNGWFGYHPENWPPSSKISPLFVSFHLNKNIANQLMSNKVVVNYFKKQGPVGCRDNDSAHNMFKAGIDSYYSGCLTTTLNYNGKLFSNEIKKNNKILLIDVLFKENILLKIKRNKLYFIKEILNGNIFKLRKTEKFIKKLIPSNFNNVERLTCYYSASTTHEQRFNHARNILKELASAKVVVTSRIHIALPCLALGTPVLFVLGKKLSDPDEFRRLDGIVNHMNILVDSNMDLGKPHLKGLNFYNKNEINWDNPPKNPDSHLEIREQLIRRVEAFISN